MKLHQQYEQRLVQKIDPRMIMANSMLQLSAMELTQLIEQELSDNPALEVEEEILCPRCSAPIEGYRCANCGFSLRSEHQDEVPELLSHEYGNGGSFDEDDEYDPFARVEAITTLQDHLRLQLRANASYEDYRIGECIISFVNDDGYLEEWSVADAAATCQVDEQRVLSVLSILQSLDPPGIAARTLQECLLNQLRSEALLADAEDKLPEEKEEFLQQRALAIAVIEQGWSELCAQKYADIARRLKRTPEEVLAAHAFIQEYLNPYPGRAFRPEWTPNNNNPGEYIKPDVVVRRQDHGFEVYVLESHRFALRINEFYRSINHGMQRKSERYTEEERQHASQYVERAEMFIRNLNQRKRTLYTITTELVDYQKAYFETAEVARLRSLTRGKLASLLGVHESTVSRATANKYLQLPWQEVAGFDSFFDASLSVKKLIGEIIESEDPSQPYSDQAIAALLVKRYRVEIARRTVEKYRDEMKILSSRKRRKRQ
ncbi:MAG TPA: RNA polymerase factor sigma-54 [Armatimonadota bacterium]|nr:RNA polymerase factor sigma-54 [Armatimonadota bacterium]